MGMVPSLASCQDSLTGPSSLCISTKLFVILINVAWENFLIPLSPTIITVPVALKLRTWITPFPLLP